jgi:hypothetical protein
VLAADNYAKSISTNYSSSAYKNALWEKSKSFTIPLFEHASHAFADLLYTAWIQAGSPSILNTGINDPSAISNIELEQNIPNPFSSLTHINYTLKENSKVLIQIRDINGYTIATLVNDALPEGMHTCEWTPAGKPAGIYYLVINTGKFVQVKKMIYSGGM